MREGVLLDKAPSVDTISAILIEAIDNLSAKIATKDEVVATIKDIVIDKTKRLKILDGDVAKERFKVKMGKGRLTKFFDLLAEVESDETHKHKG